MLKDAFLFCRLYVVQQGFSEELEWQNSLSLDHLTEGAFLQEYAWVVLASGMKEAVVRSRFSRISECFYSWNSARTIAQNATRCEEAALEVFHHTPKIRAIVSTALQIADVGFYNFKIKLAHDPLQTLRRLPYIGPITQYHIAKNIGIDVAKPDRHLTRIADLFGFATVQQFCEEVARQTATKVGVVDLAFWRFATLRRDYLDVFRNFASVTEQNPLSRPS